MATDLNDENREESDGALCFIRPPVNKREAAKIAETLYGLRVSNSESIKELDSYNDRNFYMKGTFIETQTGNDEDQVGEEFVLKILNHVDSRNADFVHAQSSAMMYLNEHGFSCSVPLRALSGEYTLLCSCKKVAKPGGTNGTTFGLEEGFSTRINAIRLLKFIPGKQLSDVSCTPNLLFNLGCYLAKLDKAFKEFSHPGLADVDRAEWDLSHICDLEPYIGISCQTSDQDMRRILTHVYSSFVHNVLPQLQYIEKQVIHGDLNDSNIIVNFSPYDNGHEIFSVLDFGDICLSYRVFELAISMVYVIIVQVQQGQSCAEGIKMAGHVLCGYQREFGLSEKGLSLLYWSVAARFFQSIVIGHYKQSLEPENAYLGQSLYISFCILSTYIEFQEEELLKSWLLMGSN